MIVCHHISDIECDNCRPYRSGLGTVGPNPYEQQLGGRPNPFPPGQICPLPHYPPPALTGYQPSQAEDLREIRRLLTAILDRLPPKS